jgi:hypothetical protein
MVEGLRVQKSSIVFVWVCAAHSTVPMVEVLVKGEDKVGATQLSLYAMTTLSMIGHLSPPTTLKQRCTRFLCHG